MKKANEESLKNPLLLSLMFHLLLVFLFFFKVSFFPFLQEDLLIQSSIRVDMVALPDKKDLAPPPPKETPQKKQKNTPVTKTPKEITKKNTPITSPNHVKGLKAKQQQSKALEKLKAMSALDKFREEVEIKNEKDRETSKKDPDTYKGNILSKGSNLTGLSKLQYDDYFSKLEKHVKTHWVLPQWLADSDYKCQIRVNIDERGFVTNKELLKSSGNLAFDNMALGALDRSSPCPIAPSSLRGFVANEGVIFNFP